MIPRWMIERKATNKESDELAVIEIYAVGENEELVKAENREWTYERELLLVEQ